MTLFIILAQQLAGQYRQLVVCATTSRARAPWGGHAPVHHLNGRQFRSPRSGLLGLGPRIGLLNGLAQLPPRKAWGRACPQARFVAFGPGRPPVPLKYVGRFDQVVLGRCCDLFHPTPPPPGR